MCRLYGKFASYFSSYKWPYCSLRERYSWFATTWQGGHVGGQYNIIFSRRFTWNPEEGNAFVLDHQHGRRDVTCKQAILSHWRINCFSIYVLGKVGKVENCHTVEPSSVTTSYENHPSKTPNNLTWYKVYLISMFAVCTTLLRPRCQPLDTLFFPLPPRNFNWPPPPPPLRTLYYQNHNHRFDARNDLCQWLNTCKNAPETVLRRNKKNSSFELKMV